MDNTIDKLIKIFLFSAVLGIAISYSKLYLFHVVFAILAIYIFKFKKWKYFSVNRGALNNKEIYFWYFFVVWSMFSVIWSYNKIVAIQNIFYLLNGLIILLVLVLYVSNYNKLFKVISIIGFGFILNMFFGLLEVMTNFRLPISKYSPYLSLFGREPSYYWDNELLRESVASTPTGFNWNPNDFSVSMMILLPYFLFSKNKIISILGSTSILFLIIEANSRTNVIAFVIIIIIFLFLKYRKVFLGGLISGIVFFIFIFGNISLDIENKKIYGIISPFIDAISLVTTQQDGDNSIGVRQKLIISGLQNVKDSKGIGIGIGNADFIAPMYGISDVPSSLHNFWLQIMVELGVVVFLAFIFWYF